MLQVIAHSLCSTAAVVTDGGGVARSNGAASRSSSGARVGMAPAHVATMCATSYATARHGTAWHGIAWLRRCTYRWDLQTRSHSNWVTVTYTDYALHLYTSFMQSLKN